MPESRTLYYCVWVSASGRTGLRWSAPCDTPAEAAALGKARVRAGEASLSVVVEFAGGKKTPIETSVYPPSARKVVGHWLDLWDACEVG